MVVRLQNNLNMDTMASAMRAAAELTVEAGRLRGQGIASIGQGIARGIEGRVRRKDDEAARAQSQSNFELSRSDRLAEQAADNARQERFHQDSMDVNNAAVLRREQEDAAKAVQEAQLGRDPEAMAEAQRRYAAATQGLQAVASRSPSAKAMLVPTTDTSEPARPDHPTPMNDEYNDIVAHGGMDTPRGRDWIKRNREQGYPSSPTIGKPGRPDTSVERGSTPRGGDPSISVPATSPVGRGSSLPITALPGAGQDAPESAPVDDSPATKKAIEAKQAEAALRLAQDAYSHSTSKENRGRLEAEIKRLSGNAASAHAAAQTLASQEGEQQAKESAKRAELAQLNALFDGEFRSAKDKNSRMSVEALQAQAMPMVLSGMTAEQAYRATHPTSGKEELTPEQKADAKAREYDALAAKGWKVNEATKEAKASEKETKADAIRKAAIDESARRYEETNARANDSAKRADRAEARVKDHERLSVLKGKIDELVEYTNARRDKYAAGRNPDKDWEELGALRAERDAIESRTKVPLDAPVKTPAPAAPTPEPDPVTKPAPVMAPATVAAPAPAPVARPVANQKTGTFARESDAVVSKALIGDRTSVTVERARAIFDREVSKRGVDPKSPKARQIAEAIKAGLIR